MANLKVSTKLYVIQLFTYSLYIKTATLYVQRPLNEEDEMNYVCLYLEILPSNTFF